MQVGGTTGLCLDIGPHSPELWAEPCGLGWDGISADGISGDTETCAGWREKQIP